MQPMGSVYGAGASHTYPPLQHPGMNGGGFMNNNNNNNNPSLQQSGGLYGMGSMYGMPQGGGYGSQRGSMYGMQLGGGIPMGSNYGFMYGMQPGGGGEGGGGGGGPMGSNYGSIYGMQGSMGSNYGSMYGMGSNYGFMYGMQPGGGGGPMGSNYGSIYGMQRGVGGGSMYGMGSQYGSMYGMGSMYGSMYRPHTELGEVVVLKAPYSITFPSNLATRGARISFTNEGSKSASFRAPLSSRASPTEENSEPEKKKDQKGQEIQKRPVQKKQAVEEEELKPKKKSVEEKQPVFDTNKKHETKKLTKSEPRTTTESIKKDESDKKVASPLNGSTASRDESESTKYSIRTLVVIEKEKELNTRSGLKIDGDNITLKQNKFKANEIKNLDKNRQTNIESKLLSSMLKDFISGHNSALLISSDGKEVISSNTLVLSLLKQLMNNLKEQETKKGIHFTLTFTTYSLNGEKVKDLLSPNGLAANTEPIKLCTSPILGTMVLNATPIELESIKDCEECTQSVNNNLTSTDVFILGTLILKQWNKNTGDVTLSSLLVSLSKNGVKPYIDVARKNKEKSSELFKYAINGPGVTVHALCIMESNDLCGEMLVHAEEFGKVQNLPPRSGNIRRFVFSSEAQVDAWKKKVENGDNSAAVFVRRLELMVSDTKQLLEDPEITKPPVYAIGDSNQHNKDIEKSNKPEVILNEVTPKHSTEVKEPQISTRSINIKNNVSQSKYSENNNENGKDKKDTLNKSEVVVIVDKKDKNLIVPTEDGVMIKGKKIEGAEFSTISEVTQNHVPGKHIQSACDSFLGGTNAAIISFDSPSIAKTQMDSPSWSTIRQAVSTVLNSSSNNNNNTKKELRASIVLGNDTEAMDLLKSDAKMEKIILASSPLFGPVISSIELSKVGKLSAFDTMVETAKKNAVNYNLKEYYIVVTLVLLAVRDGDTFVSSFIAFMGGQNTGFFTSVLEKKHFEPHQMLYRYLVNGPARTVLFLSLHSGNNDEESIKQILETQEVICTIEHKTTGNGSVSNLVKVSRASILKRQTMIANSKDSREKSHLEAVIKQMEEVQRDVEMLHKDPENNFPKAYGPPPWVTGESSSTGVSRPSSLVNKERDENNNNNNNSAAASSDSSLPHSVRFEIVEASQNQAGNNTSSQAPIHTLQSIGARFKKLQNVALLTSNSTTIPYETDPIWTGIQQAVGGIFKDLPNGESTAIDLRFVITRDDLLIADLLQSQTRQSSDAPIPLQIVASPLISSLPHPAADVHLNNLSKTEETIKDALHKAELYRKEIDTKGAMLMMSALQRRKKPDGDVVLALLTVIGVGPDMQFFRDMADINTKKTIGNVIASSMLERQYVTMCIFSQSKDDGFCSNALSVQKKICAFNNPSQSSRTVKGFISYSEKAIQRLKESGGGEEKEKLKIEKLETAAKDYSNLLKDFENAPIPMYADTRHVSSKLSSGEDQEKRSNGEVNNNSLTKSGTGISQGGGGGTSINKNVEQTEISNLVVLTAKRSEIVCVTSEDDGKTVNLAETNKKSEKYVVHEVVNRPTLSSRVRSKLLDEVSKRFLSGYNTAILTASTTPFNAEIAVIMRAANQVLTSPPPESELFLSLVGVRDNEARDLLVEGSSFAKYEIASSPLFGPIVRGAKLEPLHETAKLERHLLNATVLVEGMIIVLLVLKQVKKDENDVVISSFLASMAGTDSGIYKYAVNSNNIKERGLLQHALGGSCFTIGAICLYTNGERGTDELLKHFTKLTTPKSTNVRHGSVRRFLNYTKEAIKTFGAKAQGAEGKDKTSLERWLATLQQMETDAEEMLNKPQEVVPPSYLTSKHREL